MPVRDVFKKYSWFVYQGKTKLFNKHHREFEYTLKKGDVFGVFIGRTKNYIMDFHETSVKFSLSEKEVKTLIKSSKGLSAFKGKILNEGKGGLDSEVKSNYDTKLYPEGLAIPFDKRTLESLYALYNKRYFNNELPKIIFKKSSNAKRYEAQARVRNVRGTYEYKYYIDYTPQGFSKTVPYACDTLLHEMIHIYHYKKVLVDRDLSYVKASHGPKFVEDMNRINAHGHKIEITGSYVTEIDIEVYVAGFKADNDNWIFFYHEKPFEDTLDIILTELRASISRGWEFIRMVYGKTWSSRALNSNRLADNGHIKRNKRFSVFYKDYPEYYEDILDKSKFFRDFDITRDLFKQDASQFTIKATDRCIAGTYLSFFSFFRMVLRAMDVQIPRSVPINLDPYLEAAKEKISQADIDYIKKFWEDVSVDIIKRTDWAKETEKYLLSEHLDGREAVDYLIRVFNSSFTTRWTLDKYADLVSDTVGDIISLPDNELRDMIIHGS